jgi:hypothetical protein
MGTHSTGKTTFLAGLKAKLETEGYVIESVGDLARDCAHKGFPILDRHNYESTLWIMVTGIQLELEAMRRLAQDGRPGLLLVDRAVPDALGYLLAALVKRNDFLSDDEYTYLFDLAASHARTYQLTLRTVLDPTLPLRQGMKSADRDPVFRNLAAQCVNDVIKRLGLSPLNVTSTNAERVMETVVATVKQRAHAVPA